MIEAKGMKKLIKPGGPGECTQSTTPGEADALAYDHEFRRELGVLYLRYPQICGVDAWQRPILLPIRLVGAIQPMKLCPAWSSGITLFHVVSRPITALPSGDANLFHC